MTFVASSGDSGAPAGYPAVSPNVLVRRRHDAEPGQPRQLRAANRAGAAAAAASPPTSRSRLTRRASSRRARPTAPTPTCRTTPNPNTGFSVYDTYNNSTSAPWATWGGTSDAAPQWAAWSPSPTRVSPLAGHGSLDGPTQTPAHALRAGRHRLPRRHHAARAPGGPSYSAGSRLRPGHRPRHARTRTSWSPTLWARPPTPPPRPTHFSVHRAEQRDGRHSFSITVTALDASSKLLPATWAPSTSPPRTSAPAWSLPADYTFTGNRQRRPYVQRDPGDGRQRRRLPPPTPRPPRSLGKATVTVAPAAADHLVFGQQPTSATRRTARSARPSRCGSSTPTATWPPATARSA